MARKANEMAGHTTERRMEKQMPDYQSFPVNDAGEPLMDGAAWRYEQELDAEPDQDDFYMDDQYADYYEEGED